MCDKSLAPNNWAFTQYVSKAGNIVANITIFINITVRFSSCNPSCPKILSVYNFIVNSQQTPLNQSITNFTLLSTITGSSTATFGTVLSFNLKPNDAGFYVAFRDGGSCTSLNRVQIYYYQCPALQMGLALYPLTPAPTKQNSPAAVNASCVSGGINSTSLSLQCDNSGAWNGSVNCLCSSSYGYMTVGGSCTGTVCAEISTDYTTLVCTFLTRVWGWTVVGYQQQFLHALPRKLFSKSSCNIYMPLSWWVLQSFHRGS